METVSQEPEHHQIAAVVVTYQPDLPQLQASLAALRAQARWVIVADNGSDTDLSGLLLNEEVFLPLQENLGLAAAQNMAMERALALGAEFVFLSDQDSLLTPGMLAELVQAYQQAVDKDHVAALGSLYVDNRRADARASFLCERHGGPIHYHPGAGDLRVVEVGALIASGSLLPTQAIRTLGGMRPDYFIDYVDTEWCFRARGAGWRLLGVPAARLQHRLGDDVRRLWFFRWWVIPVHSPLRNYYYFRNTFLMLRDAPMKWGWRLYLLRRVLQFTGYFLTLGDRRMQRARLMFLGIRDGLLGRGGRLDPVTGKLTPIAATPLDPRP